MQDRKTAFLNASTDKRTVSPDRLDAKASPYVVQAGTVIPAALITGIRSDLPGQITAQVTEAVYDSPTGKYLLIPQGAKLIGQYDSPSRSGSRVLLVSTRIIMPNGDSIVLERQPGADTQGYAGLRTRSTTIGACCSRPPSFSTLLSVGAEAGRRARTRTTLFRRSAAEHPTASARRVSDCPAAAQHPADAHDPASFPVRVIVTRDLVLGAPSDTEEIHDGSSSLGPLADDKPVKISVELPAAVRGRLFCRLCSSARPDDWPNGSRPLEAHRADGRAIRGDRPRVREGATRSERSGRFRSGRNRDSVRST